MGSCNSNDPVLDIKKTSEWPDTRFPDARVSDHWRGMTRSAAQGFCIIGDLFGVMTYREQNVAIGLIQVARGSTGLPCWPSMKTSQIIWNTMCSDETNYTPPDHEPVRFFQSAGPEKNFGGFFAGMVRPLVGYGIKGVIWWQGEQEALGWPSNRLCFYTSGGFAEMIKDWRREWGQGDFPFIFNQLQSNCGQAKSFEVRDFQMRALALPNTGMGICYDSVAGIHPGYKWPVADRLFRSARVVAYGKSGVSCGPVYNKATIEGTKIRIRFTHLGTGLESADGSSTAISSAGDSMAPFDIAGDDGAFHPADAVIDGNTVLVSSPQVSSPKTVRFLYPKGDPESSHWTISGVLYNKERLPASCFRTDTCPGLGSDATMPISSLQELRSVKVCATYASPSVFFFTDFRTQANHDNIRDMRGRIVNVRRRTEAFSNQIYIRQ